ncbi:fumarylacetoacetate hydrolase family protein [Pseudolysinimonas kribbensis]|uniref:2-hydroxyhepta-2,4-diene-1,7-dioate isomerase n=1 Tax=Pseudolysinimonas kribbensis TaxID=433641 RepID=A0ABQ6K652_9MICO|nr:fumarylacetoacetate hydrolase family protein [Pseudolysinimonas kribbensis]GMA94759.1 2-hydroxyhepta-2,4-diene-1,7-dioate isomerase [Pseudolysinimonas kribbensis]
MQLLRLGAPGHEIPAARSEGVVYDLRPLTSDLDGDFWDGGVERVRSALAAGTLPVLDGADGMRVGAPVARPTAILCIGQNYAAHAAESGSPVPTNPILFFKHPNTLVGPNDPIVMPRGATQLDWEAELAVVIGRRASYLASPEEALAHIAGYTVANDVSERVWQRERGGPQWGKGKSMPTSNPLGPVVVPADEVDPRGLRIWSRVNGEPRQDSTTADMIFSVAQLVHDLSQYLVLEPGDVIDTGTPQGVAMSGRFPYLQAGDRVEVGVDGIGAHDTTIAEG